MGCAGAAVGCWLGVGQGDTSAAHVAAGSSVTASARLLAAIKSMCSLIVLHSLFGDQGVLGFVEDKMKTVAGKHHADHPRSNSEQQHGLLPALSRYVAGREDSQRAHCTAPPLPSWIYSINGSKWRTVAACSMIPRAKTTHRKSRSCRCVMGREAAR